MNNISKYALIAVGLFSLSAVSTYTMEKNDDTKKATNIANALITCGAFFRDPHFYSYVPRTERELTACITLSSMKLSTLGYIFKFQELTSQYDQTPIIKRRDNRQELFAGAHVLNKQATECAHGNQIKCKDDVETYHYVFNILKDAQKQEAQRVWDFCKKHATNNK